MIKPHLWSWHPSGVDPMWRRFAARMHFGLIEGTMAVSALDGRVGLTPGEVNGSPALVSEGREFDGTSDFHGYYIDQSGVETLGPDSLTAVTVWRITGQPAPRSQLFGKHSYRTNGNAETFRIDYRDWTGGDDTISFSISSDTTPLPSPQVTPAIPTGSLVVVVGRWFAGSKLLIDCMNLETGEQYQSDESASARTASLDHNNQDDDESMYQIGGRRASGGTYGDFTTGIHYGSWSSNHYASDGELAAIYADPFGPLRQSMSRGFAWEEIPRERRTVTRQGLR